MSVGVIGGDELIVGEMLVGSVDVVGVVVEVGVVFECDIVGGRTVNSDTATCAVVNWCVYG